MACGVMVECKRSGIRATSPTVRLRRRTRKERRVDPEIELREVLSAPHNKCFWTHGVSASQDVSAYEDMRKPTTDLSRFCEHTGVRPDVSLSSDRRAEASEETRRSE